MLDDEQETELRNPFPSPPSNYQNYTSHNLQLLSLLKSRTVDEPIEEVDQREVLADQKDVPDWPLAQLEKPRVDWILEEGQYTVFGDTWFVSEPFGHAIRSSRLIQTFCRSKKRYLP